MITEFLKMCKILLVDDDGATNFYNQYILNKNLINCEIIILNDGFKALEYIKNEALPDFIFLDINMPVMNGIQFLEEAKKWLKAKLDHMRIFVMMSVILPEDKLQSIQDAQNVEIIKSKTLTNENIHKIFFNKN